MYFHLSSFIGRIYFPYLLPLLSILFISASIDLIFQLPKFFFNFFLKTIDFYKISLIFAIKRY